jgi:hypothetical protein
MTLYLDLIPDLIWTDYEGRHYSGDYEIKLQSNGRWYVAHDGWVINTKHTSLEAAKIAAQADYEERTLERFRAMQLPPRKYEANNVDYCEGWNDCLAAMERGAQ